MNRRIRWVEPTPARRIFAERRGSGPALLLLHGFSGTARSFSTSLHTLERDYSLLAFDCIGHGRSSSPVDREAYSVAACVSDALAVIDAYDQETVHVLGYGMGARLALRLAVLAPERLAAMVLVAPELGPREEGARAALRERDEGMAHAIESEGLSAFVDAWLGQPHLATQKEVGELHWKEARSERLQHEPLGLANALRALGPAAGPFPDEELTSISLPTLLVVGELDPDSVASVPWLQGTLGRVEVCEVAEAGRAVHLEQSETFFHIVREFLRRAPQPRQKEDPDARHEPEPVATGEGSAPGGTTS